MADHDIAEHGVQYSFHKRCNEKLEKNNGEIQGQDFKITELDDCEVYLLDVCGRLDISDLKKCRIFVGACREILTVTNCTDCDFTLCCRNLEIKEAEHCQFHTYTPQPTLVVASNELAFGPFNGAYEGHEQHLKSAKLDPNENVWYDIRVPAEEEQSQKKRCWEMIPEAERPEVWYPKEEDGMMVDCCIPLVSHPEAEDDSYGSEGYSSQDEDLYKSEQSKNDEEDVPKKVHVEANIPLQRSLPKEAQPVDPDPPMHLPKQAYHAPPKSLPVEAQVLDTDHALHAPRKDNAPPKSLPVEAQVLDTDYPLHAQRKAVPEPNAHFEGNAQQMREGTKPPLNLKLVALILYATMRGVDCRKWFAPEEWLDDHLKEEKIAQGDYLLTKAQLDQRLLGLGLGLGTGLLMDAQKDIEMALSEDSVNAAMAAAAGDPCDGQATIHIKKLLKLCNLYDEEDKEEIRKMKMQDTSVQTSLTLEGIKVAMAKKHPEHEAKDSSEGMMGRGLEAKILGDASYGSPPQQHRPQEHLMGDVLYGTPPQQHKPYEHLMDEEEEEEELLPRKHHVDQAALLPSTGTRKSPSRHWPSTINEVGAMEGHPASKRATTAEEMLLAIEDLLRKALRKPDNWKKIQSILNLTMDGPSESISLRKLYEGLRKIGITFSPSEIQVLVRIVEESKPKEEAPQLVSSDKLMRYLLQLRHARGSKNEQKRLPKKYEDWVEEKDKNTISPQGQFKRALAGKPYRLRQEEADAFIQQFEIINPDLLEKEASFRALAWVESNPGRLKLHQKKAGIKTTRAAKRDLIDAKKRKILEVENHTFAITKELFEKYKDYAKDENQKGNTEWDSFEEWIQNSFDEREKQHKEILQQKQKNIEKRTKIKSDPVSKSIYSKIQDLYKQVKCFKSSTDPAVKKLRDLLNMVETGPGDLEKDDFNSIIMEHLILILVELKDADINPDELMEGEKEKLSKQIMKNMKYAANEKKRLDQEKKSKLEHKQSRRQQHWEWKLKKKQEQRQNENEEQRKKKLEEKEKEERKKQAEKEYTKWLKLHNKQRYKSKRTGKSEPRPVSAPPRSRQGTDPFPHHNNEYVPSYDSSYMPVG